MGGTLFCRCSQYAEASLTFGGYPGVESYDVNLKEQKVTVLGTAKPEEVLQTVSKTGKKTEFWREEAEAKEAPPPAPAAPAAPAAAEEAPAAPSAATAPETTAA